MAVAANALNIPRRVSKLAELSLMFLRASRRLCAAHRATELSAHPQARLGYSTIPPRKKELTGKLSQQFPFIGRLLLIHGAMSAE